MTFIATFHAHMGLNAYWSITNNRKVGLHLKQEVVDKYNLGCCRGASLLDKEVRFS